ncbi:hypothetical protein Vretimale_9729, partial [Volvox reticuliferus]
VPPGAASPAPAPPASASASASAARVPVERSSNMVASSFAKQNEILPDARSDDQDTPAAHVLSTTATSGLSNGGYVDGIKISPPCAPDSRGVAPLPIASPSTAAPGGVGTALRPQAANQ